MGGIAQLDNNSLEGEVRVSIRSLDIIKIDIDFANHKRTYLLESSMFIGRLFIAHFISFYDLSRMKNDRYNLLTHKTCLLKLRL